MIYQFILNRPIKTDHYKSYLVDIMSISSSSNKKKNSLDKIHLFSIEICLSNYLLRLDIDNLSFFKNDFLSSFYIIYVIKSNINVKAYIYCYWKWL